MQVRFLLEDLEDLVLRVGESELQVEALVQASAQDAVEQACRRDDFTPGWFGRAGVGVGIIRHVG